MLKIFVVGLTTLFFLGNPAVAEETEYGKISLNGLSRNVDWPNNPPGESSSMVCNVNGPDGYVSVRSGPGTDYEIKRSLKRLAIIDIDTRDRQGHWVKVLTASRTHTVNGRRQKLKNLHVTGWVHDDYLCDFDDFL